MKHALVILALSSIPAATQAQEAVSVPQIDGPAMTDPSPRQIEQHPAALPPQLSSRGEGAPGQAQLTSAAQSGEQPSQLSTAPRNAEPPHPLSTPEEGRTAAVARVEGKDRCDPANVEDRKRPECKHVIETRSADYARPSPTELSPEQRLMIDQQLLAREDLSTATRRLADSGNPNTIEGMGVASIVLDQGQAKQPKKPEDDPRTAAAIQAVLGALTVQPPQ